jgi:hypothetical protein
MQTQSEKEIIITDQEVLDAQKAWSEGIIKIGKTYTAGGDFQKVASDHIDDLYGYHMGTVLFKPTMASRQQFRTDKEGALSYFIGGNSKYPEDNGFAIKAWVNIRWQNAGIKIIGNTALAMGNYYFTPAQGGEELKVEYSFVYTKDGQAKLCIILHDSHLPYIEDRH